MPIAVLAVPIIDTTFATVTRLLRGRPITEGGDDHIHHRLIQIGLSERGIVAALCGASAALGGVALAALWMPSPLVAAISALCLVAVVIAGTYLAVEGGQDTEMVSKTPGTTEQIGAILRVFAGGASWKSVAGVLADLVVVGATFVVAVHLWYGGAPPPHTTNPIVQVLPNVVGAKLLVFYAFGLYEDIWMHADTPEVVRLVGASAAASLLIGAGLWLVGQIQPSTGLVLLIDWGITTVSVGVTRFSFQFLEGARVLLYGAGDAGVLTLQYLRQNPHLRRTPVAFVDDDSSKQGQTIQGIPVVGTRQDLDQVCREWNVDEVIVTAMTTPKARRRKIHRRCREIGIPCTDFDVITESLEPDRSEPVRDESETSSSKKRRRRIISPSQERSSISRKKMREMVRAVHVFPEKEEFPKEGEWKIFKSGSNKWDMKFNTKNDAIEYAEVLCRTHSVTMVLHEGTGTTQVIELDTGDMVVKA